MSFSWTDEQQRVIDARDCNLLVSAAAGSGKTAVLVERILSRVCDPVHPIDIDRILVVTFTRAAAAEMKDRIARALEDLLLANPEDRHLQRQAVLIDHAQISTIDSFCQTVLQNYYHRIDLDPGFRVAENEELTMIKKQVIEELLEEECETAEPGSIFTLFLRAFGGKRGDGKFQELLMRLDQFASSHPDPETWFDEARSAYAPETEEELEKTDWIRYVKDDAKLHLQSLAEELRQLAEYVEETPEAPQAYLPTLQGDAAMLEDIGEPETYAAWQEALRGLAFGRAPSKKGEEEDPALRESVKKRRDKIKKKVEELKKETFGMPLSEVLSELCVMRPYAEELIRLTRSFRERFTEAKRAQNLLDFSDMEHLALEVLTTKIGSEKFAPTEAAQELAARFEEVMIDEYQDSNFLQEALLASVSGGTGGVYNRFMVGDIKQSIYGFRQARPDLFLKKYNNYRDDGPEQRIDLHQNFRSRPEVLSSTNAVFAQLMRTELGGLVYDESVALHPGASYPEHPDPTFPETELYLLDKKAEAFQESFSRDTKIEAEAQLVADQIREFHQNGQVWDKDEKAYRPVKYGDIVILLRTGTGWSDRFVRVLQDEGIPAYTDAGKGFFDTYEVGTILDYLRLCNNPQQDIPLAAVLRSPIVGLSDTDLAEIRAASPKANFYEAVCHEAAEGKEESRKEKLTRFLQQIADFRRRAVYLPVQQLLEEILRETGFSEMAAVMPAGNQRQANLRLLVEHAAAHAQRKDHSLFSFIRTIESLKEEDVDYAEAGIHGEGADIVRVLTIHKSKGLEFPIVFLAGLGKGQNHDNERQPIVMHNMFGIGMAAFYEKERRIHRNTLLRKAIIREMRREAAAEELRILYVAMTRAKEKLILVGTGELEAPLAYGERPTYRETLDAPNPLAWIRMANAYTHAIREIPINEEALVLHTIHADLQKEPALAEAEDLLDRGRAGTYAPDLHALLVEKQAFRYDREGLDRLPAKMTVSELKHAFPDADDEGAARLFPQDPGRKENGLAGAARGTAYHHVFASLSFAAFSGNGEATEAQAQQELDRLREQDVLSPEEYDAVRAADIAAFLNSPLGRRMQQAAACGTLRREQPFVLDVQAADVWHGEGEMPAFTEEDTVLIQGTIDAYWIENDAYILMDYKTDRIVAGEEQELVDRYQVQLAYYSKALEQITEIPVAERWIYAVATGKEIPV